MEWWPSPPSGRVQDWLSGRNKTILMGSPDRGHIDTGRWKQLEKYAAPADVDPGTYRAEDGGDGIHLRETVVYTIDRSDAGTVRISFDFSSAPAGFGKTSVLSLNKLTGQVDTVPLTSTTGDTGYLDVLLDAGDPFLFKYDNGVPFALGP